jgi:quercetin dioxygenase-like cupin family protein
MALEHARPATAVHLIDSSFLPPKKTAALVKTDRFEAVRLFMPAGAEIPSHHVGGFVTLQCLNGHVVIEVDRKIELRTGEWTFLGRDVPHSLTAIDETYLLLTILFDS